MRKILLILTAVVAGIFPNVDLAWALPPLHQFDARIQVVWPHRGHPVAEADRVNVLAYVFKPGTLEPLCEGSGPQLLYSLNNEPMRAVQTSWVARRWVVEDGMRFPVLEFDDVDVSPATNPQNRLYFSLGETVALPSQKVGRTLIGYSNVWAHAADALTFLPEPPLPTGVGPLAERTLDGRILIVWPHDNAPVTEATRVNVTAALFWRDSLVSVLPDFDDTVYLYQGLNQEPLRPVAVGQKRVVSLGGLTYPLWDFNNIDVSAARDSRNKYFFKIATHQHYTWSSIWVHGADGRTYFPEKDVPTEGCP